MSELKCYMAYVKWFLFLRIHFVRRLINIMKHENECKSQDVGVPVWKKYLLTVDQAAQYFGIGKKKLYFLIDENKDFADSFVVKVGTKSLINRKKFEEFVDSSYSI